MSLLPNYRYHIILTGDFKESLKKLDAFCFNNQHVDSLYTLFKYLFSDKIVLKGKKLFVYVQRAVQLNHQHTGVDRMPTVAKKRLLRRNKTFVELLRNDEIDTNW